MIETFLSVLKNKKDLKSSAKKFYEFYLLKKSTFSTTTMINSSKIVIGVKMQYFLEKNNIPFSKKICNSFYVSFLKDIDNKKHSSQTKYFKIMKKYGGKKFAKERATSFINLYQNIKASGTTKPVYVYEDTRDWGKYYPDFPINKIINIKDSASDYVIFDGHHRASILIHTGEKNIPGKFVKKDILLSFFRRI